MIPAVSANLHVVKVASQDAPAAALQSKWGETAEAQLPKDVSFLLWPGTAVDSHLDVTAAPRAPLAKDTQVASIVVTAGSQSETLPLKTDTKFTRPGLKWHLLRH